MPQKTERHIRREDHHCHAGALDDRHQAEDPWHLRALGLGRIGDTNTLPDRPEIRGMIARVRTSSPWKTGELNMRVDELAPAPGVQQGQEARRPWHRRQGRQDRRRAAPRASSRVGAARSPAASKAARCR